MSSAWFVLVLVVTCGVDDRKATVVLPSGEGVVVDAAIAGELYYALIGVDDRRSLDEFMLGELGIDAAENLAQRRVVRAGITQSEVSRQDRLLERHEIETRAGAFWQAFELDANQAGGGSVVEDPFGFRAAGSVAIFTLPNGLLGFVIAAVRAVYPAAAEFARIVETDSASHGQALQRIGVPSTGDPVAGVLLNFDGDLDLARVAGELGVTADLLEQDLDRLDPELGVLQGGSIDRDDFSRLFAASLCVMQSSSQNQPGSDACRAASSVPAN